MILVKIVRLFSLIIGAFIISGVIVEVAVQTLGHYDEDGQFYFQDRMIRPYIMPIDYFDKNIQSYLEDSESLFMVYDEILGWKMRPNIIWRGDRTTNNVGIRADKEYPLSPDMDMIRIALFGDSFTLGAEVSNDEAWGYLLEQNLQAKGIKVEVLNFGVLGYGMDQAYLMWQQMGKKYLPDIVIFGFQPENINRNVNIFRPIYTYPYANPEPFSKPRFYIEGENLSLKNSPTIPVEELTDTYKNFSQHPLAIYESFYTSDYVDYWWIQSKFLALLFDTFSQAPHIDRWMSVDSEPMQLTMAIVDTFGKEVQLEGKEFIIVHLQNSETLKAYFNGENLPYHHVIDKLDNKYPIISLEDAFRVWSPDYWASGGHYSVEANQIVADQLAKDIEQCLEDESCQPARSMNYHQ